MQPLIVEIPGEYWDCQLYSGRLICFDFDESISIFRWDQIVDAVAMTASDPELVKWAFSRNDHFYRARNWVKRQLSGELSDLLHSAFDHLRTTELSLVSIDFAQEARVQNPIPFPHTESHAYNYDLFVSGRSGAWRLDEFLGRDDLDQVEPAMIWDAPTSGMATRWGALALAAGDDGLWEVRASERSSAHWSLPYDPACVAREHCTKCGYMYVSLFGASHINGGFLVAMDGWGDEGAPIQRSVRSIQFGSDLLGAEAYTWGQWNRICQTSSESVTVQSYFETDEDHRVSPIRSLAIPNDQAQVAKAEIAPFGVVIESGSHLFVITNTREIVNLPDEPIRWRCLPRSKFYFDLLMVIYEDHLVLVSFVEDSLRNRSRHTLGTSIPKQEE